MFSNLSINCLVLMTREVTRLPLQRACCWKWVSEPGRVGRRSNDSSTEKQRTRKDSIFAPQWGYSALVKRKTKKVVISSSFSHSHFFHLVKDFSLKFRFSSHRKSFKALQTDVIRSDIRSQCRQARLTENRPYTTRACTRAEQRPWIIFFQGVIWSTLFWGCEKNCALIWDAKSSWQRCESEKERVRM